MNNITCDKHSQPIYTVDQKSFLLCIIVYVTGHTCTYFNKKQLSLWLTYYIHKG